MSDGKLVTPDEIRLWDIESGKIIARVSHPWQQPPGWITMPLQSWNDPNHQPIIKFDFSPDGQFLATAGFVDASICLWKAATGQFIRKFEPKVANGPAYFDFSDDSRRIVIINSIADVLRVWDLLTGKQISEIQWDKDLNFAAQPVFSPDSSRLAFGVGGKVQVWDIEGGKLQFELPYSQTKAVNTLAFSPDGTQLAVGGHDTAVGAVIWDLTTGKERLRLQPNEALQMVAFASNSNAN